MLNMRLLLVVIRFQLVLLLTAAAQGQKLLAPAIVSPGSSVKLTCNAQRFADFLSPQESSFTEVCALYIHRKTASASEFQHIAHLFYYGPRGYFDYKTIPDKRNWTVNFLSSKTYHKNSMEIDLQVADVVCQDAGTYRCSMNYTLPDNSSRYKELTQILTVEAAVKKPILTADKASKSAEVLYSDVGVKVKLKCTVQGPQFVEIEWKREIKNSGSQKSATDKDAQYENYPVKSDITPTHSKPQYNQTDCPLFEYTSELGLQVSQTDINRRYLCLVVLKGVDVARRAVLFGLKSSENSTTAVVPEDPEVTFKTSSGVIIGIITAVCVGLILLLIAVGVVVYWKINSPTSTNEEKPAPSPTKKVEKVEKVEKVPSVSKSGSRLRQVSFKDFQEVDETGGSVV